MSQELALRKIEDKTRGVVQLLKSELEKMINELSEDSDINIGQLFSRGQEILLNFEYDLGLNGNLDDKIQLSNVVSLKHLNRKMSPAEIWDSTLVPAAVTNSNTSSKLNLKPLHAEYSQQ